MAVATTTAILVGTAVAGAAVGVAGAVESSKQAKKLGNAKEQAIRTDLDNELKVNADEVQAFQSAQRTAFAKSGVLQEGTALEVLESTRQKGLEREQQLINRAVADINLARSNANFQRRQAVLSGVGSVVNAGSQAARAVATGGAA